MMLEQLQSGEGEEEVTREKGEMGDMREEKHSQSWRRTHCTGSAVSCIWQKVSQ